MISTGAREVHHKDDGGWEEFDGGERESLHRVALSLRPVQHARRVHHLVAVLRCDHVANLEPARREGVVVDFWCAAGDGCHHGGLANVGHADEHNRRVQERHARQHRHLGDRLLERLYRLTAVCKHLRQALERCLSESLCLLCSVCMGGLGDELLTRTRHRPTHAVEVRHDLAERRDELLSLHGAEREIRHTRFERREVAHVLAEGLEVVAEDGGDRRRVRVDRLSRVLLRAHLCRTELWVGLDARSRTLRRSEQRLLPLDLLEVREVGVALGVAAAEERRVTQRKPLQLRVRETQLSLERLERRLDNRLKVTAEHLWLREDELAELGVAHGEARLEGRETRPNLLSVAPTEHHGHPHHDPLELGIAQ